MPKFEAADLIRKTIEDNVGELSEKLKSIESAAGEERAKLAEEINKLKAQNEGLQTALDEIKSRPNFSGVETTRSGEKGKFSMGRFVKLLCGVAKPDDPEYGYEMEVIKLGEGLMDTQAVPDSMKASINAATDAAGGFLIPTELMSDLIPELEAQEVAVQAGATVINGMTGNVSWAVDNGGITAEYVDSEAEVAASETAPTFSTIQIAPHVAVAVVPLTWSMVNQPAIAMEAYVQGRIGRKIALLEDKMAFLGTGSNAEPLGLFNKTGITSVTLSAATGAAWGQGATPAVTVDEDFIALVEQVASSDGLNPAGKLAFVASQKIHANLGAAKDVDGKPLFREPGEWQPSRMVGYPVFSSTQLNASSASAHQIAFGDFSEMLIARWGAMSFSASTETETNFRKLRTSIRGVMAHDVAVLQNGAFAKGTFDLSASSIKFK